MYSKRLGNKFENAEVFYEIPTRGEGDYPYNGLYGKAPPEKGTFFRPQVYKRVGISQAEVYKRVGKSAI